MKVKDLIKLLKKYDPESTITIEESSTEWRNVLHVLGENDDVEIHFE